MPVCSRNSLYSESQAFGVTEVWHFNDSNFQSLWAIINFSLVRKKKKLPRTEPKETKLCLASSWDPAWLLSCMLLLPCSSAEASVSGPCNPEPWLWEEVSKERCWNWHVQLIAGLCCHSLGESIAILLDFIAFFLPWVLPGALYFFGKSPGFLPCWNLDMWHVGFRGLAFPDIA